MWDKTEIDLVKWKSEAMHISCDNIEVPSLQNHKSNVPTKNNLNKNFNFKEQKFDGNDFVIVEEDSDEESKNQCEKVWQNLEEFKIHKQDKISHEKMLELQLPYDHIILPQK